MGQQGGAHASGRRRPQDGVQVAAARARFVEIARQFFQSDVDRARDGAVLAFVLKLVELFRLAVADGEGVFH